MGSKVDTKPNDKSRGAAPQESSIDDFASPEARFECPICLTWLRDPVVTSCGHRFCRSCIQDWLKKETACPVDNMALDKEKDVFPDNFTRREISQQRTRCPNIVRGCLEELSPPDIEAHLLICEFRLPELPDNEKLRCNFVDVGCLEKFEDHPALESHLEQSVQKHLLLLSQAYSKRNLATPTDGEGASSALAQAHFWDPPPKEEAAATGQLTADENLHNLLRALYEKIVFLEQKTREQDIILANLSEQMSGYSNMISTFRLRHSNGCLVWNFTDFQTKIKGMQGNPKTMHFSSGFYTSPFGYKLCLRINLSPKNPDFLALLIHMMKTEHDQTLDWPFSGSITITIVHPNHTFFNKKETFMIDTAIEAFNRPMDDCNPKGFGYTEFVRLEDLFKQGFINDNQLIIKVIAQSRDNGYLGIPFLLN